MVKQMLLFPKKKIRRKKPGLSKCLIFLQNSHKLINYDLAIIEKKNLQVYKSRKFGFDKCTVQFYKTKSKTESDTYAWKRRHNYNEVVVLLF